jgi:hypothetical protein
MEIVLALGAVALLLAAALILPWWAQVQHERFMKELDMARTPSTPTPTPSPTPTPTPTPTSTPRDDD